MAITYQFKDTDAEIPDEQKAIEATATVTHKQQFTLADKQRELEQLTIQIETFTSRKTDLEAEIAKVKTALNIGEK